MSLRDMHRNVWLHIGAATMLAIAALFLIRLHNARGATSAADSINAGHKLAEAWCKACHAIDATTAGTQSGAPDFAAVANMPSTTELSVKVFLHSSHPSMQNLMLT